MPGKWRYKDWQEAAEASPHKKAIAKITIEHKGRSVKAEVIKPLKGDAMINFEGSGIAIRQATSREVDTRPRWDDY